jgi:hypothetical protein
VTLCTAVENVELAGAATTPAASSPVEITNGAAAPAVGVKAEVGRIVVGVGRIVVGVGRIVGGMLTPLNVGVAGTETVVAGTSVEPLTAAVVVKVLAAGAGDAAATAITLLVPDCVATGLVPNCAATGRAVNEVPFKASAMTPIGTFELLNNNPVTGSENTGSPANSSVANRDIC